MSVKDIQIGGQHYKDMKIQPSEFIVANDLNWYEGNAVKYICRHHMKNGKQDLEKAIHYLQLAIDYYYPEKESSKKEIQIEDEYNNFKDNISSNLWKYQYIGDRMFDLKDNCTYYWSDKDGKYYSIQEVL